MLANEQRVAIAPCGTRHMGEVAHLRHTVALVRAIIVSCSEQGEVLGPQVPQGSVGPNARAAWRDEVAVCEAAAVESDGCAVRGSGEFADRVPGHYPELAQVEQDGQQEDIVRERASVKGGGSHLPEKA